MNKTTEGISAKPVPGPVPLTGSFHKTLKAIFHHPTPHNLQWMDVVRLVKHIGTVVEKANREFELNIGAERHLTRKPHTKDLTGPEVLELRHLLQRAGWSPEVPSQAPAHPLTSPPSLIVVVTHHEAKIFRIVASAEDASKVELTPYDPHHLLRHLGAKEHAVGQPPSKDHGFYERVGKALAEGGKIVVIGQDGKDSEAHHLSEYLRTHHSETYARVVRETSADVPGLTQPQLIELARSAMTPAVASA